MSLADLNFEEPITSPVLRDGSIVLLPSTVGEEKDLLLRYAMGDKYNRTPSDQLTRGLEFVKHLWIGKAEGKVGGILFMCYLEHMKWWTLDAYKNSELSNAEGDYSFRSGKLVIDWFFQNYPEENELHTMHRTDNKLATKLCKRLGFEEKFLNPQFIILSMRRLAWELKQL